MRTRKVPIQFDENRSLIDLTVRSALGLKVGYWSNETQRFRTARIVGIQNIDYRGKTCSWSVTLERGNTRFKIQAGGVFLPANKEGNQQ